MSSLFSALASQATNQNPNQNQDQNNNNSNNGRQPAARGGGFSIANSALRSAGLMDDSGDTGMRTAGPSRTGSGGSRGGGRVARRGGSRNGEGPSRMSVDDTSFSSSSSRGGRGGSSSSARDRSNPLAQSGRSRRGGSNASRSGADSGIRGAADRRGRVPGGGELIGSSSASVIAAAQNGNSNASGSGSSSNQAGGKLIEGLKRFLASRWNEAAQFLNLENMSQDPILREMGFKPPGVSGSSKDSGSAIFKLCSEIYPNITTISLARNNLVNLGPVSTIPVFLPSLKNISLEGNELKWVKDLNSWLPSSGKSSSKSSKKAGRSTFKGLSELVLTGNPVKETFTATGNEESYRSDVLRKFPTLTLLDGVPVTTAESDFAKLPSNERKSNGSSASGGGSLQGPPRNFGIGMRPGFKEPTAEDITNGFLSKYFTLFDSDRDSLGAAYAENSTFTFAVNGHSSPRARSAGYYKSMPNQLKLDWSAYNTQDPRNVMRGGSRKVTGVRQGPNAITTALKHFPRTIHPVNDPSKFVVDSWILPNDNAIGSTVAANDPKPEAILFINVHGEFLEKPSEGIRSFDRAFIVAPAPPGSTASNAGWPCLILNDQLTFRHYAGSNAWIDNALPTDAQPGTYVAQPSASTSTATSSSAPAPAPAPTPLADLPPHLQNQPPQAGINEQQHLLSLQLAAQTGLTYPFAVQCMEGNSWDPAQAMANFQTLKASNTIPPEAFALPQL